MEYLTAAEYARMTGRGERTVRGWIVKDGKRQPGTEDVDEISKTWVAPKAVWDRIASQKGGQGRRDHDPRVPKKAPEQQ